MKANALAVFRQQPKRHNCAQAVLHGYQQISNDLSLPVDSFQSLGGGRAPGGLCGAIHAACAVAPEKSEVLKAQFAGLLGSFLCSDIRGQKKFTCDECVGQAADLLEKELRK